MNKLKDFFATIRSQYYSSPRLVAVLTTTTKGWVAISTLIIIVGAAYGLYTNWKQNNASPTKIVGRATVSQTGDLLIYSGTIENDDTQNADDFVFSGIFGRKISDFQVNTLENAHKESNDPAGKVVLTMNPFSAGGRCEFDILIPGGKQNDQHMQMVWKGGKGSIQIVDDRSFTRGIELGEKIRRISLSQQARAKWVDDNSKSIGIKK